MWTEPALGYVYDPEKWPPRDRTSQGVIRGPQHSGHTSCAHLLFGHYRVNSCLRSALTFYQRTSALTT